MATAAAHTIDHPGAVINTVSVSGDVALDLHEIGSSALPWLCVSRLLGLVWIPVVVEASKYVEMDFQIVYEGNLIGEGSMMSLHPPRASIASS